MVVVDSSYIKIETSTPTNSLEKKNFNSRSKNHPPHIPFSLSTLTQPIKKKKNLYISSNSS